tara:strand:+ start:1701 stop:1991 length:291 start_codon:yes stop_codon:yes gene_type:complete
MKIDKNTTLKIARLSRIKINDAEVDELSTQLNSILDWVEQLNEVDTENIDPLNNVSKSILPLRKDEKIINNNTSDVLKNAPEKLEDYFVVPKVVEE